MYLSSRMEMVLSLPVLCEQELFSLIWAGEEIVFSSSLFPLFEAHFFASFLSPKMQIFLGNDGRGCSGKK